MADERYRVRKTAKAERNRVRARVRWSEATTTGDNPAGMYLARRALPELIGNPVLRSYRSIRHMTGGDYPAMLAVVRDVAGNPVAVHRTYLTANGCKADLDPAKASLGPIMGGAIRLGPAARKIVVGKGIETTASAGLLLGLPAWSAISAGNMARAMALPDEVREIVIAADDDVPDEYGCNPGMEAAEAAAVRWETQGRAVRILTTRGLGYTQTELR